MSKSKFPYVTLKPNLPKVKIPLDNKNKATDKNCLYSDVVLGDISSDYITVSVTKESSFITTNEK